MVLVLLLILDYVILFTYLYLKWNDRWIAFQKWLAMSYIFVTLWLIIWSFIFVIININGAN